MNIHDLAGNEEHALPELSDVDSEDGFPLLRDFEREAFVVEGSDVLRAIVEPMPDLVFSQFLDCVSREALLRLRPAYITVEANFLSASCLHRCN